MPNMEYHSPPLYIVQFLGETLITSTQKNLEFSTRVGTIAHRQKVLKQAGVVHDIKSQ